MVARCAQMEPRHRGGPLALQDKGWDGLERLMESKKKLKIE